MIQLVCPNVITASTGRYRLMWRDDPATSMVIGWQQFSGGEATVYYDVVDHGTSYQSYAFSKTHDSGNDYKGMANRFARLTGLTPNTVYYFVLVDAEGVSQRYSFQTMPNQQADLSIVSGGDSRNGWDARIRANKMVAKLRPDFVMFGGDMTSGSTDSEWQNWLDHWQHTIAPDGRMTPIIVAEGNHENWTGDYSGGADTRLTLLFDVINPEIYYSTSFAGGVFCAYTLSTEVSIAGNQTDWLAAELAAKAQHHVWNMVQYHTPMRPHVASKLEGNAQYSNWANLFYQHEVDVVVECDAHCVKSTWPVRPSTEAGSEEGFIRDDQGGTIYLGEGTWGAPLRTNDDNKSWTRASGSFNQFKWLHVTPCSMDIYTVKYDNVDAVGTVSPNNRFAMPSGIDLWNVNGSDVVRLEKNCPGRPNISWVTPTKDTSMLVGATIELKVSASYDAGVQQVEFLADSGSGEFSLGTVTVAPYKMNWTPASGSHTVRAKVTGTDSATKATTVRSINVISAALKIPGQLEFEDYFNAQGVIVGVSDDVDNGNSIGYLEAGDYAEYFIEVADAGLYQLNYRVAGMSPGQLSWEIAGQTIGVFSVAATGAWNTWQTQGGYLDLEVGSHVLKLNIDVPGFNLNWVSFQAAQAPTDGSVFHSWNLTMNSSNPEATLENGDGLTTRLTFYESSDDFGIDFGTPLSSYFTSHPDAFNLTGKGWGQGYPYAALSGEGRGASISETGAPPPTDVYDLQMHPPNNNHSTVAAFEIPFDGEYRINMIGIRRVHNDGSSVRMTVFDAQGVSVTSLTSTSRAWELNSNPIDLGFQMVGESIYFAVDNVDGFAYDAAEIIFSVEPLTDPISTGLLPTQITTQNLAFPNPFSEHLILVPADEHVSIFNAQGSLVYEGNPYGGTIPTHHWAPGVYTVWVDTKRQRLIKVR